MVVVSVWHSLFAIRFDIFLVIIDLCNGVFCCCMRQIKLVQSEIISFTRTYSFLYKLIITYTNIAIITSSFWKTRNKSNDFLLKLTGATPFSLKISERASKQHTSHFMHLFCALLPACRCRSALFFRFHSRSLSECEKDAPSTAHTPHTHTQNQKTQYNNNNLHDAKCKTLCR